MVEKSWYLAIKKAAAYWIAGIVFTLAGGAFVAVGALIERFFLIIGIPFLGLGSLILALLIYSLYLNVKHPENYGVWLWWINFIGGLSGALLFAIPSTLALPILLLIERAGADLDLAPEARLIGAAFSVIGLAVMAVVWLVARRQYRGRPRWTKTDQDDLNI